MKLQTHLMRSLTYTDHTHCLALSLAKTQKHVLYSYHRSIWQMMTKPRENDRQRKKSEATNLFRSRYFIRTPKNMSCSRALLSRQQTIFVEWCVFRLCVFYFINLDYGSALNYVEILFGLKIKWAKNVNIVRQGEQIWKKKKKNIDI